MARGKADEEEVSMAEAAKRLAMTMQGVGQWADKAPPEYVRVKKTRRTLIWPGFMVWYRQRLQERKNETPLSLAEAQLRSASAKAEMDEMERDKMRETQIDAVLVREEWSHNATTIRSQLLAIPGRYAARIVGLQTLPEAQRVLDHAMRDVLAELKEG